MPGARDRMVRPRAALLSGVASVSAVLAVGTGSAAAIPTPPAHTRAPQPSRSATGMYGKRYCELILVSLRPGHPPLARVFNSFPYNACPQAKWVALDTTRLAAQNHVSAVVRNGPRYWTIDGVQKFGSSAPQIRTFGGIQMADEAILHIADLISARKPYTTQQVARDTIFHFNRGRRVYELLAPGHRRYMMQSYSQGVDPKLKAADLRGLGRRLKLPHGWRYRSRVLSRSLSIVTTTTNARVLQDDLGNSYSMEAGG